MTRCQHLILVDAHVHIYPCFSLVRLLDSAACNFERAASRFPGHDGFLGVLLLAESGNMDAFGGLVAGLRSGNSPVPDHGEWRLSPTQDHIGLYAENRSRRKLLLVAGRQIVSAEGLEILGLFMEDRFRDGEPAVELLGKISATGAIPVLPWGVGKWFGSRGRLVKQLLVAGKPGIRIGDNSGRPWFWPSPDISRLSAGSDLRNLPGTDPLPLPGEERRVGACGIALDGVFSEEAPVQDIRRLLCDTGVEGRLFGRREGAWRFFRNQALLRARKLLKRDCISGEFS